MKSSAYSVVSLATSFLLGLFLDSEIESDMFLPDACWPSSFYKALCPWRYCNAVRISNPTWPIIFAIDWIRLDTFCLRDDCVHTEFWDMNSGLDYWKGFDVIFMPVFLWQQQQQQQQQQTWMSCVNCTGILNV
jgi:hypothetical protein